MATPAALQALKVPGSLVVNPTTDPPTDAAPHGGTFLGLVKDVRWVRAERRFDITAEEYGGEVVEPLYMGEQWDILFTLRSYDADALNNLFPNTTNDTPTGTRAVTYPDTTRRSGSAWSTSAVKLLFSPEDTTGHHAVYFRSAVPLLEPTEVAINRTEESLISVGFRAIRDGTTPAASVQMRLLEKVTL